MSTILVTSGSGYIASWTILKLLAKGYDVRASVCSENRGKDLRTLMERNGADTSHLTHVVADLISPKAGQKPLPELTQ